MKIQLKKICQNNHFAIAHWRLSEAYLGPLQI